MPLACPCYLSSTRLSTGQRHTAMPWLMNSGSSIGNLLAGQHDTQKPRSPPSHPVSVTFPCFRPPVPSSTSPHPSWTKPGTGIAAQFLRLKKPKDVTKDTLVSLNVTFQPDSDFETLLSSLSDRAPQHLPPRTWLDLPAHDHLIHQDLTGPTPDVLSNGWSVPRHKEFHARIRELYFNNRDAFSSLSRKSCRDQPPLRLSHFRKFWEGLDNLAYYWDTSLDIYSPSRDEAAQNDTTTLEASRANDPDSLNQVKVNAPNHDEDSGIALGSLLDEEPRKKVKTEATSETIVPQDIGANGFAISSASTSSNVPSQGLPARIALSRMPQTLKSEHQDPSPDLCRGSYSGYRIGNGAEMPDQYRIDCVKAFVEPIAWAFGVTLSPHRRPPLLTLGPVNFPVRMSSVAWRGPQDRVKARQGWMEGPVFGIQCRADVNFGKSGNLEADSILDVVRELGGLLLLAQERAREGKVEKRAGDGKWWTSRPRWGGGPGGEVGEACLNIDTAVKGPTAKFEGNMERNRDGSRVRRKTTPSEAWKTLKVGNPLWDPKIAYQAIGRDKSDDWDDIFMISSLNHHISVVRLHIHRLYLQYITEGNLSEKHLSDTTWFSPKLQRTRWFDLFSTEDRTEAMRGIWGIISYLMRTEDPTGDPAVTKGVNTCP